MDSSIWVWVSGLLGYVTGLITALARHVISEFLDERRNRKIRNARARGDLKSQIHLFCDQWKDRDVILPFTKSFRTDLVESIAQTRENLRLLPTGLPEKTVNELLAITAEFLSIAKKNPRDNDGDWCRTYQKEIDNTCKRFKEQRW